MAIWEHFHSLYEAMAAINIGFFAFPRLSRPFLREEERRWRVLCELVGPDHKQYRSVERGARRFNLERRQLETTNDQVRAYCLAIGILAIGMLCFATARAEDAAMPVLAWGATFVMATPAIVMFGLNSKARCRLANLAVERRQLEQGAML